MDLPNGGPAFPTENAHQTGNSTWHHEGMTLRDYLAAKAMPAIYAEALNEAREGSGLFQIEDWRVGLALDAYSMADAMLIARGKWRGYETGLSAKHGRRVR